MIPNPAYRVLLIAPGGSGNGNKMETEIYSEILREIPDCQVDVLGRIEDTFDWIARLNYHLVVLDASPALDLLERIRRLSPASSVLILSENASVEEAVAAIRLGAEDYLKKPVNLDAFRLAVKRGLDRKAVLAANTGMSSLVGLLNACQLISASLDEAKIFEIIQSYFQRELKSNYSATYQLQDGEPARVSGVAVDRAPDRAMEEILDIALQVSGPLQAMTETGETYRFVERGQLTPGLFIFRYRCAGDRDSFCVCLSPERPESLDAFESRLRMLATQIALSGKNVVEFRGVQSLVYVDDATGLYNTRYLNNILDREIAQAEAARKSFAVLFIDADRFKGVNDAHGHLIGTKLLNELGHRLKAFTRERDTVFRYGGDEFVAVLSPCDLETAQRVAERIRASVEKHEFLADEGLKLHFTVSIGVALFPDHAHSKREVIEAADHAMYAAKRTTRNSVFIFSPTEVVPSTQGLKTQVDPSTKGSKKKGRKRG